MVGTCAVTRPHDLNMHRVPPNLRFEVDDVEADWTYHQKFDYIHSRFMGIAIKDWPKLVRQCNEYASQIPTLQIRIELSINRQKFSSLVRYLLPGGYAEFIDLDLEWTSPDGSLTENHASLKFNQEFRKACRATNAEPCPGPLLEGYLKDAGFEDVVAHKYVWPVGTWPADRHLVSEFDVFLGQGIIRPMHPLLTTLTTLCRKKWARGTTCKSRRGWKGSRTHSSHGSWATPRRRLRSSAPTSARR